MHERKKRKMKRQDALLKFTFMILIDLQIY